LPKGAQVVYNKYAPNGYWITYEGRIFNDPHELNQYLQQRQQTQTQQPQQQSTTSTTTSSTPKLEKKVIPNATALNVGRGTPPEVHFPPSTSTPIAIGISQPQKVGAHDLSGLQTQQYTVENQTITAFGTYQEGKFIPQYFSYQTQPEQGAYWLVGKELMIAKQGTIVTYSSESFQQTPPQPTKIQTQIQLPKDVYTASGSQYVQAIYEKGQWKLSETQAYTTFAGEKIVGSLNLNVQGSQAQISFQPKNQFLRPTAALFSALGITSTEAQREISGFFVTSEKGQMKIIPAIEFASKPVPATATNLFSNLSNAFPITPVTIEQPSQNWQIVTGQIYNPQYEGIYGKFYQYFAQPIGTWATQTFTAQWTPLVKFIQGKEITKAELEKSGWAWLEVGTLALPGGVAKYGLKVVTAAGTLAGAGSSIAHAQITGERLTPEQITLSAGIGGLSAMGSYLVASKLVKLTTKTSAQVEYINYPTQREGVSITEQITTTQTKSLGIFSSTQRVIEKYPLKEVGNIVYTQGAGNLEFAFSQPITEGTVTLSRDIGEGLTATAKTTGSVANVIFGKVPQAYTAETSAKIPNAIVESFTSQGVVWSRTSEVSSQFVGTYFSKAFTSGEGFIQNIQYPSFTAQVGKAVIGETKVNLLGFVLNKPPSSAPTFADFTSREVTQEISKQIGAIAAQKAATISQQTTQTTIQTLTPKFAGTAATLATTTSSALISNQREVINAIQTTLPKTTTQQLPTQLPQTIPKPISLPVTTQQLPSTLINLKNSIFSLQQFNIKTAELSISKEIINLKTVQPSIHIQSSPPKITTAQIIQTQTLNFNPPNIPPPSDEDHKKLPLPKPFKFREQDFGRNVFKNIMPKFVYNPDVTSSMLNIYGQKTMLGIFRPIPKGRRGRKR
jgi:hypothetical protein